MSEHREVAGTRWYNRPGSDAAAQLRELLAADRAAGTIFWIAWPRALRRLRFLNQRERMGWLRAFGDPHIRDAFWDAYERRDNRGAIAVSELEDGAGLFPEHDTVAELRTPRLVATQPQRETGGGWDW